LEHRINKGVTDDGAQPVVVSCRSLGGMMTTKTTAMLNAYPAETVLDKQLLTRSIETCVECSQACTACADADAREQMASDLAKCARLNLDCADMCETTARVLTRQTGYDKDMTRAVVEACAQACKICGEECDRHAQMHEHCAVCAEVCHRCERACNEVLAAVE
jgi:hypothetical protein